MKKTKIFEYFFITLFILIVLSLLTIGSYRSIVNSEWYESYERKKEFQEDVSKLNDEGIQYLEYHDAVTDATEHFYDVDDSIFSEIACNDYSKKLDQLERYEVLSSDRVSVFFEDGSLMDFYITDELNVYWGTTEIKADNLIAWYLTIRD